MYTCIHLYTIVEMPKLKYIAACDSSSSMTRESRKERVYVHKYETAMIKEFSITRQQKDL